jgi:hypothetical protein
MGKKVFLNVVYNLGIFIAVYTGYWGIVNKQYAYVLGAAFIAVIFVVLKVRLIKEVRGMQKKP